MTTKIALVLALIALSLLLTKYLQIEETVEESIEEVVKPTAPAQMYWDRGWNPTSPNVLITCANSVGSTQHLMNLRSERAGIWYVQGQMVRTFGSDWTCPIVTFSINLKGNHFVDWIEVYADADFRISDTSSEAWEYIDHTEPARILVGHHYSVDTTNVDKFEFWTVEKDQQNS